MKKNKVLLVIAAFLFISSYSEGEEVCMLGLTPSGKKCGKNSSSTSKKPYNSMYEPYMPYDGSSWHECIVLKGQFENEKSEIKIIKSKRNKRLAYLRNNFTYNRAGYNTWFHKIMLPKLKARYRDIHDTEKIRSVYRRVYKHYWNKWQSRQLRIYSKKKNAVIQKARRLIRQHHQEGEKIRQKYMQYKCKKLIERK
jgi:Fe-S cluster biosynthesis and repair protein YggX